MGKKAGKTKMTKDAARRIQSKEARKRGDGTVPKDSFAARAMKWADLNTQQTENSQQ